MFVTRTDHDGGTSYQFYWTQSVIDSAEKRGFRVTDLKREKVNRKSVSGYLKTTKPGFIFFNGHGDDDVIYGHNGEIILTTSSINELKGGITYARACGCVNKLGKEAVNSGCTAFIGYSDEFIIPWQHGRSTTPLKDAVAKPVMEASNAIAESLIKGSSVREAVEHSQRATLENLMDLLKKMEYRHDPDYNSTVEALVVNNARLTALGNLDAKISERE